MIDAGIAVEVVHATPDRQVVRSVRLRQGATVADALVISGLWDFRVDAAAGVGLWGRVVPTDTVLRDGDRVEIYRALVVDPKEARRRRHAARVGKT